MEKTLNVRGALDQIILNQPPLYEGNLVRYFQIIFNISTNVNNPYHNFRHMMHVTWLCHDACRFYADIMTPREMRNLLIAAMFHDFDHRGTVGEDIFNIMLAVQGLEKHLLPEDRPFQSDIIKIVKATEYPYKTPTNELNLSCQIIRDTDLSQALNPTWLQQVIFGLASEWKKSPMEVLKVQNDFHRGLRFYTAWAQNRWSENEIQQKIDEVNRLVEILEMQPAEN